ncbi:Sec-independent protein translocase subunit TatA/TatB [Syntrophomonas erecta]
MFAFIGNIGPWELILILLVALIVVGPGKLPEVAKSMGKALGEFKRATSGVKKDFEDAIRMDTPASSAKPARYNSTGYEDEIIINEEDMAPEEDDEEDSVIAKKEIP